MLSRIIDFINKTSSLINVVVTPLLLLFILKSLFSLEKQLNTFSQIITVMQAVDNTTLAETTSVAQLMKIMTAAAAGKALAGSIPNNII